MNNTCDVNMPDVGKEGHAYISQTVRNRRASEEVTNGKEKISSEKISSSSHGASHFEEKFADVGVCGSTGVRIKLCYQTFGEREAAAGGSGGGVVLLIMGLASPSLVWDMKFCLSLASRGCYVIRFDNRDIGRSTFLSGCQLVPASSPPPINSHEDDSAEIWGDNNSSVPPPSRSWLGTLGDTTVLHARLAYASLAPGRHKLLREVYTLEDMAKDCVGLLDALRVQSAHVVGMCMGGMIAQAMAIHFPQRVASLSLMSTHSSSPHVVRPSLREALAIVNVATVAARRGFAVPSSCRGKKGGRSSPSQKDEDTFLDTLVNFIVHHAAGGGRSLYPVDRAACAVQVRRMLRRSSDFSGVVRQCVTMLNASSRAAALRGIDVSTVVLHGTADSIVPFANGKELVGLIPHAKFVAFDGLGHVLHPAFRERIVAAVVANMQQAKRAGSSSRDGNNNNNNNNNNNVATSKL